jgi:hypothetical protein
MRRRGAAAPPLPPLHRLTGPPSAHVPPIHPSRGKPKCDSLACSWASRLRHGESPAQVTTTAVWLDRGGSDRRPLGYNL